MSLLLRRTYGLGIHSRIFHSISVGVLFLLGLVLGILFFHNGECDFVPLMRRISVDSVSIVGAAVAAFLPFLLSAFVIYIQKPSLVLIICFLKGIVYGFCSYGICVSFESCGWLLRCILLFSDICMLPALLWFWLNNLQGTTRLFRQNCNFMVLYGSFVCFIDYYFISAYLARMAL